MANPITFTAATPRFDLPNLFPGQAQKEFYVNEALARLDVIAHPAIQTEISTPPTSPGEGECWLIGSSATGSWTGYEGNLAGWQAGAWVFVPPLKGLRIFDISTGGMLFFDGVWQRLAAPTAPTGGASVDTEARDAIVNLIETLRVAGILPAN